MKLGFKVEEHLTVDAYPDKPVVYRFIKSGWPDLIHVLWEDGAYNEADHQLLSIHDIERKYMHLKGKPEWEAFING